MSISVWAFCQLLAKFSLYCGFAASVGGPFIQILSLKHPISGNSTGLINLRRYGIGGALMGLFASSALFLIQVGNISDSGLSGMFDPLILELLWASDAGTAVVWQIIGFVSLLLANLLLPALCSGQTTKQRQTNLALLVFIGFSGFVLGLIIVPTSFAVVGHVSVLAFGLKALLLIHVLLIALWMGSLWPLLTTIGKISHVALVDLLRIFSQWAMAMVAILLVCGAVLAYNLVGTWSALVASTYGWVLLAKILGVAGLLALAAVNKIIFTRRLELGITRASFGLATSIKVELSLGLLVLVTTSVLTTMVGPNHI